MYCINAKSMATKKERIVFYVNEKIKQKLTELAELDNRSLSNWLENLALEKINNRDSESEADKANTKENFKHPKAA